MGRQVWIIYINNPEKKKIALQEVYGFHFRENDNAVDE